MTTMENNTMKQHSDEISAAAARDVQRLQRSGYRGIALLRDPASRTMVAFTCTDRGCASLGVAAFKPEPGLDDSHTLVCLPGLQFDEGATPSEVFAAVEREIQRLASWTVGHGQSTTAWEAIKAAGKRLTSWTVH